MMRLDRTVWERRIHEPFVLAALGIALTAGFGYAALLVGALALQAPLGDWWGAAVQAHGHAQIFGWVGLFVSGMALYFLPKLAGRELKHPERAPYALSLIAGGIVIRSIAQPALGFDAGASFAIGWRVLWVLSALAEFAGFSLIASILIATRMGRSVAPGSPEWPVYPFILLAFASMGLAFLANWLASISAAIASRAVLDAPSDALIVLLMLFGMAVPIAFVFSIRNLPLFMRLAAPPRRELRLLAYAYALALALRAIPSVAGLFGDVSPLVDLAGEVGEIGQGLAILAFVWILDLPHLRAPWTASRPPNTRPDLEYLRKPTRKSYPDAGEYGRFELLIYSSYSWLVVAALLGISRAVSVLSGIGSMVPADAERHALTVGFITLLIFGMAARLMPGFSHRRRLAFPGLVGVTFVLGNLAALLRVVPLLLPSSGMALVLLGTSGAIGWAAVACLAVNIVQTLRS